MIDTLSGFEAEKSSRICGTRFFGSWQTLSYSSINVPIKYYSVDWTELSDLQLLKIILVIFSLFM